MAVVSKSTREQEQLASVSKPEVAQELQLLSTTTIREYAQTLEKCTKSASEYLRCASLLCEARDSYDKLRRLSDEIRKLLDTEEMKLRSLMDQVQKTANEPSISGQAVTERRGPESFKAESVIANGEKPRVTRFP
jgi:DNA repair exonuclease SbcCD ATPase subunit